MTAGGGKASILDVKRIGGKRKRWEKKRQVPGVPDKKNERPKGARRRKRARRKEKIKIGNRENPDRWGEEAVHKKNRTPLRNPA